MAMIESTARAPFGAITVHRIVSAIDGFAARIRSDLNATRTADELSRLSPRMRADIGILDCDIVAMRQKSFLL